MLMAVSGKALAQHVDFPENAEPRANGVGWKCSQGYRREGNECEKIAVPVNASLSIDGRGWRCERGYQRDGDECSEIKVPANADLRLQGSNWYCLKGFERDEDVCAQVVVPANAELTWGGSDWRCLKGYNRIGEECRPSGIVVAATGGKQCPRGLRPEQGRCRSFTIPVNATYTEKGDDWTCMAGFAQQDGACTRLSRAERLGQDQNKEHSATIDAMDITLPSGGIITIGDIRQGCNIVAGTGTYDRFDCEDENLTLIETGCYVRNDAGSKTPIECPSYRLRSFVDSCIVSTIGSRTRQIECPSPAYLARLEE
nr:hypothetical protein GCM10011355_13710 [Aquisalinus luteolus]